MMRLAAQHTELAYRAESQELRELESERMILASPFAKRKKRDLD